MSSAPTLEEVWSLYGERLRQYLRSRASNSADIDDVLQVVLYKTHKQLPTVRNLAHLRSWLFRVASNALVDHERRVAGRREDFDATPASVETSKTTSDAPTSDQVELSSCVRPFIQRLPERDRDALEAVDLEGITQRALADQLGVSYSTLKSRVQRARNRLAADLLRCCAVEAGPDGQIVGTPRMPAQNECKTES